ncbi:MAG: hypothetical protein JJU28_22190 [Cyclobacteriaceae bacterium]|nr:hypothetical protein [Cyclobacteriaceae bacterium]
MVSRLSISYFLLLQLLLIVACNAQIEDPAIDEDFWANYQAFDATYDLSEEPISNLFASSGKAIGHVSLQEASGLVASIKNDGMLWAHNDSGNPNVLFLIDKLDGNTIARYRLNGINNIDWEDIEIGPGPEDGEIYLYIGDIGDNNGQRPKVTVYRFAEPVFDESHRSVLTELYPEADRIRLVYPDRPRDAETLLLDPITKDIYVVSKREFRVGIYIAPYPQSTEEDNVLIKIGNIPVMFATGGNVSADGDHILIRTYNLIYYWKRENNENMWDTFQRKPIRLPYDPIEPQGEAICWSRNGGYYTLSELNAGIIPQLYFYERK